MIAEPPRLRFDKWFVVYMSKPLILTESELIRCVSEIVIMSILCWRIWDSSSFILFRIPAAFQVMILRSLRSVGLLDMVKMEM